MDNNNTKTNIVLIGFMGSGKTVVGRNLARLLDYQFMDTDEEIRSVTGLTLPQLFRKHGEIRFRSEEELVIKKLADKNMLVIASGGSLTPIAANFQLLQEKGWMVLLSASPEIILERISRKNDRLLLSGKPNLTKIKGLIEERNTFYQQMADMIVDTSTIGVEEAAQQIAAAYTAQAAQ